MFDTAVRLISTMVLLVGAIHLFADNTDLAIALFLLAIAVTVVMREGGE